MKLFHCPRTRSARVMWMCRELGITPEIQVIDLFKGEGRNPDFLKINPNGFVPVLTDGDVTLVESGAILMHLADKFADKGLAPAVGTADRATYYQYMTYSTASLDPACELVAYHSKVLPEKNRVPGAADYGRARFRRLGKACAQMLGEREFVVGGKFSAADIMISSSLEWANRYDMLADFPSLFAYVNRMKARPAFFAD